MEDSSYSSLKKFINASLLPYKIGRYDIIETLGEGGMGKVYKAYDERLKRTVAIKVLNGDYESEKEKEKILKEAKYTAQINNAYTVKVYDVGYNTDKPYIVMEYIDGINLAQYLSNGIPDYRWTLKIIYKIALAINDAHKVNIIHRDIKPANIMLVDSQTPKIMDFGLAKCLDKKTSASSKGMMIGTIFYMSPEQIMPDELKVDRRTDIYGLGALMYEMLTGKPPFDGDSTIEIAMSIINKSPISIKELNPNVPLYVEKICMKCLRKKPEERYQDISTLCNDIDNILKNKKKYYNNKNKRKLKFKKRRKNEKQIRIKKDESCYYNNEDYYYNINYIKYRRGIKLRNILLCIVFILIIANIWVYINNLKDDKIKNNKKNIKQHKKESPLNIKSEKNKER